MEKWTFICIHLAKDEMFITLVKFRIVSIMSQKNFKDINLYYQILMAIRMSTSYRRYVALKER
jgi:hypothetical protein